MSCTPTASGSTESDPAPGRGTLQDAVNLIPYLLDLGVNCVELMPMSEFQDRADWGYSTSHYFAIEYSGGGRDKFKHFVRECHRNGIAVILDVVYNHYTFDEERAEWAYDSNAPENNIYYWYEGRTTDYAQPDGGYLDNGSSGWAPRFWEEMVRKMFTSSAAALASEFHFDGFRVDLTQAIHRDNVRARRRPFGRFGQPVRAEAAARVVEHAAADPPQRVPDRRGPHRLARRLPTDRPGRPRLRRHLVRRLLPSPDR